MHETEKLTEKKKEQLEQDFKKKLDDSLGTLKRVSADACEKTDYIKADANRRIREMERLCAEKVDGVKNSTQTEKIQLRSEFETKLLEAESREKEAVIDMNQKLKIETTEFAEEIRRREANFAKELQNLRESLQNETERLGAARKEAEHWREKHGEEREMAIMRRAEVEALKLEAETLRGKLEEKIRERRRGSFWSWGGYGANGEGATSVHPSEVIIPSTSQTKKRWRSWSSKMRSMSAGNGSGMRN